jgi:hypothetical protein
MLILLLPLFRSIIICFVGIALQWGDATTSRVSRSRLRTNCRKPRKKEKKGTISKKKEGKESGKGGKGAEGGGVYYGQQSADTGGGDRRYEGDSFGKQPYTIRNPIPAPPTNYIAAPSPTVYYDAPIVRFPFSDRRCTSLSNSFVFASSRCSCS